MDDSVQDHLANADRDQNNSPLSWRNNSRINFAATGDGNLPMVNIKWPYPEMKFNEGKGGVLYHKKRRYMDESSQNILRKKQ